MPPSGRQPMIARSAGFAVVLDRVPTAGSAAPAAGGSAVRSAPPRPGPRGQSSCERHRTLLRHRRHQASALSSTSERRSPLPPSKVASRTTPDSMRREVEHLVDEARAGGARRAGSLGTRGRCAGESGRGRRSSSSWPKPRIAFSGVRSSCDMRRGEDRLRAVRAFGLVLGRDQRLLRELALGDVDSEYVVATTAVGQRRPGDVAHLEVQARLLGRGRIVTLAHRYLACQRAQDMRQVERELVAAEHFCGELPHDGVRRSAEAAAPAAG